MTDFKTMGVHPDKESQGNPYLGRPYALRTHQMAHGKMVENRRHMICVALVTSFELGRRRMFSIPTGKSRSTVRWMRTTV